MSSLCVGVECGGCVVGNGVVGGRGGGAGGWWRPLLCTGGREGEGVCRSSIL